MSAVNTDKYHARRISRAFASWNKIQFTT